MKNKYKYRIVWFLLGLIFFSFKPTEQFKYFSPIALEMDKNNEILYIAGKTGHCIIAYDLKTKSEIASYKTALSPKDIKLAENKLLAACSDSKGELLVLSAGKLQLLKKINVGHGACAITVSKHNDGVYVANQFSDDISVVSLKSGKEIIRIPVLRQPTKVELSQNGKNLFVTNFLTEQNADAEQVTAKVSVIDLIENKLLKNISLASGSNALRGMCLSKDGRYIFVTHNLGRFQVPTTQLEQGWMNTSGLSIIDAKSLHFVATILLDEPDRGAAGSWGIDCSENDIYVAHSGTHDISKIDYHALVERLENTENKPSLAYDLRFLSGIRERIPANGNGPRDLLHCDDQIYCGNYFSDEINIIDPVSVDNVKICLNDKLAPDSIRLGEMYFNDARFCFQEWQSCNGCHPNEARTDGLNWDLLNDGIGNPKNCKSMLFAHVTAPSMITGIRPNAETAVRAGFQYIQFTTIDERQAKAVDHYLKSLQPVASPKLVNGKLSKKAKKGKRIFKQLKCDHCHSGIYFTDFKKHEIGRPGAYDHQNVWDTPTLIEVWRTGPYLHDGRCATMQDVFKIEKHGIHKDISDKAVEQLTEYVLCL